MTLFWSVVLKMLVETTLYLAKKLSASGALFREKIRALPPVDRASVGFFLAALVLVAFDQVYWVRYWQTPNYLAVLAAMGALGGLIYRISTAQTGASVYPDRPVDRRVEVWSTFAVFIAFLAWYSVTGSIERSPYNAHVRQAIAFLHLHTDIERSPGIEQVVFAGRYFQLHPPLPAILLMPFVAIWGTDTNQTAFSLVAGAIDAALAWWLLGRLKLSLSARVWLTRVLRRRNRDVVRKPQRRQLGRDSDRRGRIYVRSTRRGFWRRAPGSCRAARGTGFSGSKRSGTRFSDFCRTLLCAAAELARVAVDGARFRAGRGSICFAERSPL